MANSDFNGVPVLSTVCGVLALITELVSFAACSKIAHVSDCRTTTKAALSSKA
jgi:hypothetical protein